MKVAVLAGGFGTRLAEETEIRPKPMVEIGGKPVLWHIMKIYAHYGFKDFVIALGYKGEYIKKYMVDYCSLTSNLTVNLKNGEIVTHDRDSCLPHATDDRFDVFDMLTPFRPVEEDVVPMGWIEVFDGLERESVGFHIIAKRDQLFQRP